MTVLGCDGSGSSQTEHHLTGDAATDAVVCVDMYEAPDPFDTGVASTQASRTLPGAMICPAGDKDYFEVTITEPGSSLEMIVDSDPADPWPWGTILNSTGIPISNTSPVTGTPNETSARVVYLPQGIYYAMVFGAPGDVSHYSVTVTVTGP